MEEYGTPADNPEFWSAISANSFLEDLSEPIQLHHRTADASVPLEFSESLFTQLQQAGKETELYTYPDDNHNLSNSFSQAMTRTILFFDKHLKDAN